MRGSPDSGLDGADELNERNRGEDCDREQAWVKALFNDVSKCAAEAVTAGHHHE